MLQAATQIRQRIVKSKGHTYEQTLIFIPRDIAKDSAFPFKSGDSITIKDKTLVIEYAK